MCARHNRVRPGFQKWCAGNVQINLGPRLLTSGSQLTRFVSADPIKSDIIRL